MNLIKLFSTAVRLCRNQAKVDKEKNERAAIARAFNDRYTYRRVWDVGKTEFFKGSFVRTGYAWMCPNCNTIHRPTEFSSLTGLQYPKCCTTPAGHRLNLKIRTP